MLQKTLNFKFSCQGLCKPTEKLHHSKISIDWFKHPCRISQMIVSRKINLCGAFNKFPDFFILVFKIGVDSWKFSMLLPYILWDGWPVFMISGSNEQLQQEFEYTLLRSDCHSWWVSKMQSGCEEERYAIKFCFKLGKNATETYVMLQTASGPSCRNQASVFEWHKRFKEGWESVRDDEGVRGVRKSIHQSLLPKGLGLGLLCSGLKGVQEEIPSEEASTLQITSVAFPLGQCTSPQLHPRHRLFEQDGHEHSSSGSL